MNILQKKVIDHVKFYIDLFNEKQNTSISYPEVKFTKKGSVAGCVTYDDTIFINFNMVLLKENTDDFLTQTVPHEVAHYCVWAVKGHLFSKNGRRIIHGTDWKNVMRSFGCKTDRCHNYCVKNSMVRKMKTFKYKCDCGVEHDLTSIRHNRVLRGTANYKCTKCNSRLVFCG